ncbi:MAG: hypothetical protein K0S37_2912 [Microbacterium sp.]|nr:hypothetical protein [Microbacterium sp.]
MLVGEAGDGAAEDGAGRNRRQGERADEAHGQGATRAARRHVRRGARRRRLGRRHLDRTGGGAGNGVREDPRPPEHGGEGDHLEEREVDGGCHEEPGPREEEDEDQDRRHRETAAQAVQQHGRGDQQRREAEDHHARDLVVQILVAVEGNAAHERQVDPDHGEAQESDRRCSPSSGPAAQAAQIATYADRIDDDEHPAELESAVEQGTRDIVECSELAEVQLPPERIGRGHDRREDATDEHDQDQRGQVHRRQGVRASCQSAHGGDDSSRRREGEGGRNGLADRDAHFGVLSLGTDRKPPSTARPSAPVGLIG